MSDGMRRELVYLSSHATNRYFIPNWGIIAFKNTIIIIIIICSSFLPLRHLDEEEDDGQKKNDCR